MNNIYKDGTYLENNPMWHQDDSPWKASKIIQILNKNNLKPSSICEVGCGAGEILLQLSSHLGDKIDFTGYDISPQAIELCKEKTRNNLNFFNKDLLKESNTNYDVTMAIDVFEHIEDYLGFLKQLRSNGNGTYYIFHIPLDISVLNVVRAAKFSNLRKSIGHIHYFTKDTALESLKDSGYEIVDYFYTNSSIELPNRGWKATLLKIPRRIFFIISKDLAVRILGGFSLLVLAKQ